MLELTLSPSQESVNAATGLSSAFDNLLLFLCTDFTTRFLCFFLLILALFKPGFKTKLFVHMYTFLYSLSLCRMSRSQSHISGGRESFTHLAERQVRLALTLVSVCFSLNHVIFETYFLKCGSCKWFTQMTSCMTVQWPQDPLRLGGGGEWLIWPAIWPSNDRRILWGWVAGIKGSYDRCMTAKTAHVTSCLTAQWPQDPLRLGGGGEEHLDRFLLSVERANAETEQRLRQHFLVC